MTKYNITTKRWIGMIIGPIVTMAFVLGAGYYFTVIQKGMDLEDAMIFIGLFAAFAVLLEGWRLFNTITAIEVNASEIVLYMLFGNTKRIEVKEGTIIENKKKKSREFWMSEGKVDTPFGKGTMFKPFCKFDDFENKQQLISELRNRVKITIRFYDRERRKYRDYTGNEKI